LAGLAEKDVVLSRWHGPFDRPIILMLRGKRRNERNEKEERKFAGGYG
jgi:hypothetical protein